MGPGGSELADERWLSPQDRDSNARLVREHLLKRAEGAHFDPLVRIGKPLTECVYTANLQAQHSQPPSLVALGMGNDGHTASLFPGSKDLARALESTLPYAALDATGCPGANQWPLRITLTPHGLRQCRQRLLLLRGKQKLQVLRRALDSNAPSSTRSSMQSTRKARACASTGLIDVGGGATPPLAPPRTPVANEPPSATASHH